MSKLLISTAIAGLLALSGAALAQGQDDHRGRGDHNRPAPAAAPAVPAQQAERPQIGGRNGHGGGFQNQAAQNAPTPPDRRDREDRRPSAGVQNAPAAQPAPAPAMRAQGPATDTRGPATDRRAFDNNRGDNNRSPNRGEANNFQRGPDTGMRAPDNRGNFNRGPSTAMRAPNRDFSTYHRNFTAPRRYHVAGYTRPRGWYPHRWTFGEILPALFWSQNYWLSDYEYYGLEPPPPGTVWVRDGSDALLIDRFDGEIIEVAYSVFY